MARLSLWILLALPVSAATPLFNGAFDASNKWTTLRGISFPDPAVSHEGHKALCVQPQEVSDAVVQSSPVQLSIGRHYEVTAWIRTEGLEVHDTGRTPIALGASVSMASLPYDMHSESFAGTRPWTRVKLRFIATHVRDSVVLSAGEGGTFRGKAWFEGVSIDEVSSQEDWPAKPAVKTYGPGYRYPFGGWIYLHIEGEPYERGYQHGFLMAKEVVHYIERCQSDIDPQSRNWSEARTVANSLFLRGFDTEILEEMKGIADGANAAGATWEGRKLDLIDIVTANVTVELGELRDALPMTPTGLEGLHLESPLYHQRRREASFTERCSAFAATGKATRDGRMVIAHLTMWPLTLAEQTNVMLDIKPAKGNRILMQSYPGGIESGTDWYQNDSGIVLTETTIRQGPFNPEGTPIAYRARRAIQYGSNIDKVVQYLSTRNNGLYTNEWLIADAKNDEIAMFEMGTYKQKLWRSTKGEWFGGTEGFYWGCNNAKDLDVRLEYQPDPKGAPAHVPFVPESRDLKWQEMYERYRGKIDDQFAFLAFRTAPLVSSTTMDAKVVTAEMAHRLMVWATFGKPNQREWTPSTYQKQEYSKNNGIYPSGYRLFTVDQSDSLRLAVRENEQARLETKAATSAEHPQKTASISADRLWNGWVLPATDADTWFTAGSAAYYADLQSSDLAKAMEVHWAGYREAKQADPQTPIDRYRIEMHRGALLLDALHKGLGDDRFLQLMREFFAAHTTHAVKAKEFLDAAGTTPTMPQDRGGAEYMLSDIFTRLGSTLLVYGTVSDAGANRYAAEQLQKHFLDRFESAVPIRKDFEASDDELKSHDVIFVGRPETNSVLAGFRYRLDLAYDGALFRIGGQDHASENEALAMAVPNPADHKHMFLILGGNSALQTVLLTSARLPRAEYAVFDSGQEESSGFLLDIPGPSKRAKPTLTDVQKPQLLQH
jgi:hypothetical protein